MRPIQAASALAALSALLWCAGCGGGGGFAGPVEAVVDDGQPAPGLVARTIQGWLVDAAGVPVANAVVGLPARSRQTGATTGTYGRFVLAIHVATTATSVTLEVTMPHGSKAQSVVDLPAGQTTVESVVVATPNASPEPGNVPPAIANATVSPTTVEVTGAMVRVAATVTDPDSQDLTVVALLCDGDTVTSTLLQQQGGTYSNSFSVAPSLGASAADRTCEVWICATDAPRGSCSSVSSGPMDLLIKGMPTPPSLPPELG